MTKNRRCANREFHDAHVWRGLNTRGEGYQCAGLVLRREVAATSPDAPASGGITSSAHPSQDISGEAPQL